MLLSKLLKYCVAVLSETFSKWWCVKLVWLHGAYSNDTDGGCYIIKLSAYHMASDKHRKHFERPDLNTVKMAGQNTCLQSIIKVKFYFVLS